MRIAINGFGRIGRLTLRRLIDNADVEIAAINDLTDLETLTHLLKWDSVHGKLPFDASAAGNDLIVNGKTIKVFSEADPAQLPWKDLKIDIVLECTGRFVTEEGATKHLEAGAKKVILSAPGKGNIKTVVIGVNEETLTADERIVSNASCTTNCLAPMAKVLDENFGIEKGYISTVHAYTADQQLQDAPHRDLRRARAAALSIIPTSTGAAAAVGKVLPQLKGKLDGIALRVPVPDGSLTDFTVILKTNTTTEAVNAAIKNAAQNEMKGILEYSEEPLVSVDIVGNSHSCIFDSALTTVNDNLVKIVGWYDNEYGYACRTAELALLLNSL
jgi:glyceraldehyde 3-phosphate dehydrogenase